MRLLTALCAIVVLVAACRAGPAASGSVSPSEPDAGASAPTVGGLLRCEGLAWATAPEEWYGDSPIYVANEQPTTEILDWASTQPGFEDLWIDRDHLGWIAVGFSEGAEARQADLERLYPDVGVVAVEVEHPLNELLELQQRVSEELGPLLAPSSYASVQQGVVGIGVGVLTDERLVVIEERFGDEPICVEGIDAADAPAPGPQAPAGDGWRLLAAEPEVGDGYRTGIAFDPASYRQLWADIGLSGEPPSVDFNAEVVIWFGAVHGSSCPNIRLDDVVVDPERALVYADIVMVDAPSGCTADAIPRAYVVALERARLPAGPFGIQLSAEDPPAGVPEERTLVDVDLSSPGAVAAPGDVHGDPSLPEPFFNETGAIIEPGYAAPYRFNAHCGIEWLGELNAIDWRTEVPATAPGFVPAEWQPIVNPIGSIEVSLLLRTDPEPVIEATANGHTVVYRPSAEDPVPCQ